MILEYLHMRLPSRERRKEYFRSLRINHNTLLHFEETQYYYIDELVTCFNLRI